MTEGKIIKRVYEMKGRKKKNKLENIKNINRNQAIIFVQKEKKIHRQPQL